MLRIVSGTCFYNDYKSLERTLESLKDKVDVMICVDGKFKHYEDDNPSGLSNDGSRELVESYDNALLLDRVLKYEIEKRTAYLDACDWCLGPGVRPDYLLIIDSDEYVGEYDEEKFMNKVRYIKADPWHQSYNVYGIMLEVNSPSYDHIVDELAGRPYPTISSVKEYTHAPRLWYKPYEMMYNKVHYYFINKDPSSNLHHMQTNPAVEVVPGLWINHDHILRNWAHLVKRKGYQSWLVKFEQEKLPKYVKKTKLAPNIQDYDNIDHDY